MAHDAPKHTDDAAVKPTPDAAQDDDIKTGEWQLGLFSCFEHIVPNCCMVTWCPCVSLAQVSTRLGVASYSIVLVALLVVYTAFDVLNVLYIVAVMEQGEGGTLSVMTIRTTSNDSGTTVEATVDVPAIALPARIVSFIYGFAFIGLTIFLRHTTRARYQIPGNIFFDTLASCFCNCCAIAQIASHVKSYKKGSCGFGPVATLPAYPQSSA
ncbi:hypothetical protein PybrP1_011898 [[Pythium] brassicae (nom. inval.)]|nr:hypothetical protein PybrP1_011898 [[Pythium] brassicae (nom. inval.)]